MDTIKGSVELGRQAASCSRSLRTSFKVCHYLASIHNFNFPSFLFLLYSCQTEFIASKFSIYAFALRLIFHVACQAPALLGHREPYLSFQTHLENCLLMNPMASPLLTPKPPFSWNETKFGYYPIRILPARVFLFCECLPCSFFIIIFKDLLSVFCFLIQETISALPQDISLYRSMLSPLIKYLNPTELEF